MNDIKDILNKYNIKPKSYRKIQSVQVIDTKEGKYVLKMRSSPKKDLYNYLKSRSFNYFPNIYNIDSEDDIEIYEYLNNYNIPKDEKAIDLINLVSLLHSKTTHYKNIDIDDYKKIYEDIHNKLDNLTNHYNNLSIIFDNEIYMSPSNYLLARNISKINSVINYCYVELDSWYELIKESKKQRVALIHNNLELDHLIKNEGSYLISWDKSKMDIPIYDIYTFYKRHYSDLAFPEILKSYEERYPFKEEERKLLFILISIPDEIELTNDEYENTKRINNLLYYIYKSDELISPYYSK